MNENMGFWDFPVCLIFLNGLAHNHKVRGQILFFFLILTPKKKKKTARLTLTKQNTCRGE